MQAILRGEILRTTVLCIDSYHRGILQGRFFHPTAPSGQSFHSLTQFLLAMEQHLNHTDYPTAFTLPRVFLPPAKQDAAPSDEPHRVGKTATFSLRILFRQNTSWQGSLTWIEGNQEQSFRSVLELITLLDSALTQQNTSEKSPA